MQIGKYIIGDWENINLYVEGRNGNILIVCLNI